MKRYAFYLLIMAAAVISACNKETLKDENTVVPEVQKGTYIYTINASIQNEEPADEVAVLKSDYNVVGTTGIFTWSAGDAISVLFHNGATDKFFTLTTTGTGANVSFSGVIEDGYTIGASNGTVSDKKIWALFPASNNHTYTAAKDSVSFYVQPSVDFSATHFSANVPMMAKNTEEGDLSFANIASTYQFLVSGIKAGVSKVQFTVYNQTTYGLSGNWPITGEYLNYNWASPGTAKSTLSYIEDVSSNQAVFYVSCRYWGTFQPNITVSNYATGVAIKTFTATSAAEPHYMNKIKPITLDVSEDVGGGVYYATPIIIDGDLSDWDGITEYSSAAPSRIRKWRIKNDAYFVYIYVSLRKDRVDSGRSLYIGFDTDNDSATGTTSKNGGLPLGLESYVKVVPFTNAESAALEPVHGYDANSKTTVNGSSSKNGTVFVWDYDDGSAIAEANNAFVELRIPRSELALPAAGNSITVNIAYNDYVAGAQSITLE